jgi:hypothetical protein
MEAMSQTRFGLQFHQLLSYQSIASQELLTHRFPIGEYAFRAGGTMSHFDAKCPVCGSKNVLGFGNGACPNCEAVGYWRGYRGAKQELVSWQCGKCDARLYPPVACRECGKQIHARFWSERGAALAKLTALAILILIIWALNSKNCG